MPSNVVQMLQDNNVKYVDLRFTDTRGKEQHVSVSAAIVNEAFFEQGKVFDGSSIAGWKQINNSDMLLLPDAKTAVLDPFCAETTLNLHCDVIEPSSMLGYSRDPRSVAKRAEAYMQSTGIADQCFVGPEPEFFIFDDVRWDNTMNGVFYSVDSEEAAWNTGREFPEGNMGHRQRIKGGYFPVPPVDSSQDLRSAMCEAMEQMGLIIEAHHHEVASGNQNEISTKFNTLCRKADELQILKYVVHNVAHVHGKTATFMPKPLMNDNGNGMHCHQSLFSDGRNLFDGDQYAGLSETALHYIGGIIRHARALNVFTNATTNSYKRLLPGFEAPVLLSYSSRNRSAAIRIPFVNNPKSRRIEIRFPDAAGNPYLTFASLLMAGLDGIQNKIHPGDAMDKDLYDLSAAELKDLPTVSASLEEALKALEVDYEFLTVGDVFTRDMLEGYVALKHEEIDRLRAVTHPIEFDMYYSS